MSFVKLTGNTLRGGLVTPLDLAAAHGGIYR
jgi:hypothetical protein